MRLKQDSANKYYNSSEGTLHLVTVMSSYSPFAEPFAKEAPKAIIPKGSSPPIVFNYFLLRVVGSIRAGAPKALIPNASFNSSLLFLTIVTNKRE